MHLLGKDLLRLFGYGLLRYLIITTAISILFLFSTFQAVNYLRHSTFVGSVAARSPGPSVVDAVGHYLLNFLRKDLLELLRHYAVTDGVGAGSRIGHI